MFHNVDVLIYFLNNNKKSIDINNCDNPYKLTPLFCAVLSNNIKGNLVFCSALRYHPSNNYPCTISCTNTTSLSNTLAAHGAYASNRLFIGRVSANGTCTFTVSCTKYADNAQSPHITYGKIIRS